MLMDRYTFPTADAWGIFDDGLEPVDEDGIIAENVRLVEQYIHSNKIDTLRSFWIMVGRRVRIGRGLASPLCVSA